MQTVCPATRTHSPTPPLAPIRDNKPGPKKSAYCNPAHPVPAKCNQFGYTLPKLLCQDVFAGTSLPGRLRRDWAQRFGGADRRDDDDNGDDGDDDNRVSGREDIREDASSARVP